MELFILNLIILFEGRETLVGIRDSKIEYSIFLQETFTLVKGQNVYTNCHNTY